MTWAKNVRRFNFYPGLRYYNDEIIESTKTYFHTDEKLFEYGCIENVSKIC